MSSLSIVIPAYNEENRLPRTLDTLKRQIEENILQWNITEILVVNDGSTDGTAKLVEGYAKKWNLIKLLDQKVNRGKGAVVHAGMRAATAEWVLVADADMATPWEEMNKFLAFAQSNDLIMGSRALKQSEITIRQHWIRQNMGRTFNKILKSIVGLPYQDTQCGFKMIRNDQMFREKVLPKLKVERFAWDVELILQVQKNKRKILESPIRWSHQEESHVHIFKDSIEMFWTVLKLRLRG